MADAVLAHFSAATALPMCAATTLALALALGGGPGGAGDVVVQLASVLTLGLALHALPATRLPPAVVAGLLLAGAAIALPLLQLLPLPQAIAAALPGRDALAGELASVGAAGLSHLSLAPRLTERSLWALLPGVAMFVAALALAPVWRERLLTGVVAFAAASVVLGLAQIADGPDSALRFYRPTYFLEAVGFFANRNHFASLLYVALALAVGLLAARWRRADAAGMRLYGALAAAVVVLCLLGLGLARSRMGLLLGMAALLGSGLILVWSVPRGGPAARRWLLITATLGALAVVQFSLYGILSRLETDPLSDSRWRFFANTHALAATYAPVGSGLGTFVSAYQSAQAPQEQESFYVNHAHNDYLELALEGGWLALGWAIAFVLWWLWCTATAWRRSSGGATVARAASLALGLLMLHATVDYPLRTSSMLAVAGLLCATLPGQPAAAHGRRNNGI